MAQYFLQCVSQFYCFAADESLQKEDLSTGRQPTHTLTLFARRLANCTTHILSQDFPKCEHTGCFFNWYPPKKLKYGKPRLGESTLT